MSNRNKETNNSNKDFGEKPLFAYKKWSWIFLFYFLCNPPDICCALSILWRIIISYRYYAFFSENRYDHSKVEGVGFQWNRKTFGRPGDYFKGLYHGPGTFTPRC